jgi:glucosamine-6-phosphate deaminase
VLFRSAFNEPKTNFDIRTHLVELDTQTRLDNSRFFKSFQDVPTHALTLGIKDIFQSKHILMIAIGQKKADAVNQMINGPITNLLPASILQDHPSITVYLDTDAASKL